MRTLLTLLLLIPSLSFCGEDLRKELNYFHLKIKSDEIFSSQLLFHAKQLSDSSNYLKIASDKCYKALLKNTDSATYSSNIDCLLVSSAFGNTKKHQTEFFDKMLEVSIYTYNFFTRKNLSEQEKRDATAADNYHGNFSQNIQMAYEVITFAKQNL